jgi:photosystem II stability/assembly factor-like uncharacterized protein
MKIVIAFIALLLVFMVSGCSTPAPQKIIFGNVMKSEDGGDSWTPKVEAGEKKNIAGVEVLSVAIHPAEPKTVYIGTRKSGIFKTEDGGELWSKLDFPPIKTYGLAVDSLSPQTVYASGVWQERGKIYKSENGGANWKEIYTEPGNGTVVTALAASPYEGGNLYGATSEGAIFHTNNGGDTWQNIYRSDGPVTAISFDGADLNTAYFLVLAKSILKTRDGGATVTDLGKATLDREAVKISQPQSLAVDKLKTGTVYVGMKEGIIKSENFGDSWQALRVLESSKKFPVNAIAVNTAGSSEILYSSAQAVYKSTDSGGHWATFQLDSRNIVSVIKYNPANPSEIYLGMKKE